MNVHSKIIGGKTIGGKTIGGKTIDRFRSVRSQSNGLLLGLSVVLHSAIALLPLKAASERPEEPVLESSPPITVTRLPNLAPLESDNSDPGNSDPGNSADSQSVALQPVLPAPPPSPIPLLPVEPVVTAPITVPTDLELPPEENAANAPTDTPNTDNENIAAENTVEGEGSNQQSTQANEPSNEPSNENPNEAAAAEMAAVWEGFLGGLPSGLTQSNLQQILSVFGQPEQEALFFDDNQQPKTSVVSHYLLEDKTPEQVFEEIVNPQFNGQQGFDIQTYGEFADGPVYQIMQGEIVHYLNIVPLDRDSVLIVGDRPPNV